ncbi:helix-turn-helix domain-containing protein [Xanthomonas sacchari]
MRLAQARERAGLSQKQLGILAGLDPSVASPRINQYERGRHEPQLKTAKQLAEVLGIPPAFCTRTMNCWLSCYCGGTTSLSVRRGTYSRASRRSDQAGTTKTRIR